MDETSDLGQSRGLETHLHRHGVRSALTADFLHLPAEQPLSEASRRMAAHRQTAAVVAFAEGDPGIVTERDVLRVLAEQSDDPPLAHVAARPLATVAADASLLAARERMRAQGIRHLGVTDGEGGLMGLLEFSDLLAASEAGLVVNAGHGLNYHNCEIIAAIPGINELNIGHAIIARAMFVGLKEAVVEMKRLIIAGQEAGLMAALDAHDHDHGDHQSCCRQ